MYVCVCMCVCAWFCGVGDYMEAITWQEQKQLHVQCHAVSATNASMLCRRWSQPASARADDLGAFEGTELLYTQTCPRRLWRVQTLSLQVERARKRARADDMGASEGTELVRDEAEGPLVVSLAAPAGKNYTLAAPPCIILGLAQSG